MRTRKKGKAQKIKPPGTSSKTMMQRRKVSRALVSGSLDSDIYPLRIRHLPIHPDDHAEIQEGRIEKFDR